MSDVKSFKLIAKVDGHVVESDRAFFKTIFYPEILISNGKNDDLVSWMDYRQQDGVKAEALKKFAMESEVSGDKTSKLIEDKFGVYVAGNTILNWGR
jgi:hypothetical protein